jgi:uncharacterized protein YaaR (DUF327 family)
MSVGDEGMSEEEIEFNNGFVTALALFYAHLYQQYSERFKGEWVLIICGATDHLIDMEVPNNIPQELKERVEKFKEKALSHRYDANEEIAMELFNECLEILKEIDEKMFGLSVIVKCH